MHANFCLGGGTRSSKSPHHVCVLAASAMQSSVAHTFEPLHLVHQLDLYSPVLAAQSPQPNQHEHPFFA
eukprot:CAMPEP_0206496406 /NCGR_PEP_ID=MMETSP0324_2-20121206/49373_1 /ASSEMBLY_ACC=CAM_ASM_000836 /TAXON_ID=2866 /ORGANISM="Crypthecodinium cohnii, Strain Seligo" /LENGTH=68 /DNA_ID=CAMNT_0053981383 /DNA_START=1 /DNA_END=204 /DNA_ORIENTATION=-